MITAVHFPLECLEDIFRHLKSPDLLECTLVCPSWNLFIGFTKSCMAKIELNFRCNSFSSFGSEFKTMKRILVSSDRKYERLSLVENGGWIGDEILEALSAKNRKWTVIKICDFKFKTPKIFVDFLKIIHKNVREWEMYSIIVNGSISPDLQPLDLQFP